MDFFQWNFCRGKKLHTDLPIPNPFLWQGLAVQWHLSINPSWPSESCWLENSWVRRTTCFLIALSGNKREKNTIAFLVTFYHPQHFMAWSAIAWLQNIWMITSFSEFWGKNLLISCDVSYFLYWNKMKPIHFYPDTSDFKDIYHISHIFQLSIFYFSLCRNCLMTLIFWFEDIDILQIYVMMSSNLLCVPFLNNHAKYLFHHYRILIWHFLL